MIKFLLFLILFLIPVDGFAAITAVTSTANTGGSVTGSNFTLTSPTGTTTGDVLVIIIAERTSIEKVTRIDDNGGSGGHTFTLLRSGLQATNFSTSIWYHVVGASDGTTWTVTNTSDCEAGIMAYRGVDNTTPIDAQGTTNTGTSSTGTFNAVTTVTANAWYVGGFASNVTTGPDLSSLSSGSPTPNNRTDTGNGGSNTHKELVSIIDVSISSVGSSGTFVYNLANSNWSTDSFALRPVVAAVAPTVTTSAPYHIESTTAIGSGNVTSDGGATITQRGVCWNTSSNPTTSNSTATTSGTTGVYTVNITGLSANTTYHVRAYAINSAGTSYGSDLSFTTTLTGQTSRFFFSLGG